MPRQVSSLPLISGTDALLEVLLGETTIESADISASGSRPADTPKDLTTPGPVRRSEGETVSAAVMGHPSRRAEIDRVAAQLAALDAVVALDPEPDGPRSSVRAAIVAWGAVRDDATHHLVVQDDAILHTDFVEEVARAVADKPDCAIAFHLGWSSVSALVARAAGAPVRWIEVVDEFCPSVALALPADVARRVANETPSAPEDDVHTLKVLRELGVPIWVSAPCYADHPAGNSLVGNDFQGERGAFSRGFESLWTGQERSGTTLAVRSVPFIDTSGPQGAPRLRWLVRDAVTPIDTRGHLRVRTARDGLLAEGLEPEHFGRLVLQRCQDRGWVSDSIAGVQALFVMQAWLMVWGLTREARRNAIDRATADAMVQVNLARVLSETGLAEAEVFAAIIDDAMSFAE